MFFIYCPDFRVFFNTGGYLGYLSPYFPLSLFNVWLMATFIIFPEFPLFSPRNWCSSIRSRPITYIAACKTEKYIVKSQRPCPNGTPDCQKIMYRAALKPVYQVKHKVISSLYWKCCPGYSGKNCEHHGKKGKSMLNHNRDRCCQKIIETHQSHEAQLEDLQNDVQQATNHLGILQKALQHNISRTRGEVKHNRSGEIGGLEQTLFPHMENFLREHFQPVWASLNKSLQDLSTGLKNLSHDVEANRRSIERFQETTVPKKDFQELGTKFESKVQTIIFGVEEMKRELEDHFHQQQAAIHYNLTMIKADTDIKLKRNHKNHLVDLSALNNSLSGMRQEQSKLQRELEALSRNLVFPIQPGSPNEAFAEEDTQILNQSLAKHARQLKELYEQSDEDYQELNQLINSLKASTKQETSELRINLMEKSLIIEEYRESMERKIVDLNNTLANIEERQWDLERSLKICHCENLPLGIAVEEQENITQIYREEIKQLEARLKDLAAAFPLLYQSLDFQQEQNRKLEDDMSLLRSHTDTLSEIMGTLKKTDEKMHGHIKYLNSSFNSLLVDAMRHEKALVAMLGDEIMETLSEDDPESLFLPPVHLHNNLDQGIMEHMEPNHEAPIKTYLVGLPFQHRNDFVVREQGNKQGDAFTMTSRGRYKVSAEDIFATYSATRKFLDAAAAQSHSRFRLFVTSWTSPRQSSLLAVAAPSSFTVKPVTSRIPSIHLALGRPLFLFPSIFPSITGFNGTHLNYGKGYFPEHNYFKAPQSGVYMVAISMELPPEPALGQLAFSNGQILILTGNKRRKASGGSMTTFVLVELMKGERMWFELVQDAVVKRNPAGLSMAGFLIFKT
uniref:Multimerin 2 n=1 Tax=Anolis carolinensis TaxID=28377 RepID=A0A803T634_ANOCA